ncbi:hypothetical protein ONR07_24850, partial [Salmonella enterica subsp. enterica serovar Anatum]|nr:hypothetical protein [Salmonella enterica subsp. enterica serovar Anatum]
NGHAAKAGALAYLDDVNLMELFSGLTDLPLVVENDANCAALGGNEAATRLSGISVSKVKIIVYSLCGLAASLAGIIEVARL